MTVRKQELIANKASMFYGVFPTDNQNRNHSIIIAVCKILDRVQEYRGAVRGSNALPQSLLEAKYTEFWDELQEHREHTDRTALAGKEAIEAVSDTEDLLNWIFLGK